MERDAASGFALLLGSLCFIVTMVFHPSSGSVERLVREAPVSVWTHSLALASIPVTFLGLLGVHHRLKAAHMLSTAALVAYGFGSVAAMCAAVLNGLAAPAFATRFASEPATRDMVRAILTYNSLLNTGFAKVFMVAAAAALVLWSIAILRTRALAPWAGWVGGLVGGAGLVSVLGGFLGTSVHEFGLFILGLSAWTVSVGVLLCQSPAQGKAA
ncbi:MAG TPA: hypothetical protein VGK94_00705 [Candidatus Polarisedimenticolia bacterium]|jgi:hypothetical protein